MRSNGFRLNLGGRMQPYPCDSTVEVDRPRGDVPNHLPGTNKYLAEFAERYHIPFAATRGGAETAYPEYAAKLRAATAATASGRD